MISPVRVFKNESESFIPSWAIIDSSKGSGAFAFSAAIVGEEMTQTRINRYIIDNI